MRDRVFFDALYKTGHDFLLAGDLRAGFLHCEFRRHPFEPPVQPRYTGQFLNGEAVILAGEQGWGDMIMFAGHAGLVADRGGKVVLAVPKPMHRLAARVRGVTGVLTDSTKIPQQFYFQWLMSLPVVFQTSIDTVPAAVPYIAADPAPWAEFLDTLPGLKVGLCWAGKPGVDPGHAEFDSRRSMRLAQMAPILNVPGCSFVSLQLGGPAAQLRDFPIVRDVAGRLLDWTDTADLIAGLDLVISVDTAVAHLAGALGKPVWLLNRHDSCWRWLTDRTDTPWYPNVMRIYRQPKPGDWRSVIADVARDLSDLASKDLNVSQHPPSNVPHASATGPADEPCLATTQAR